MNRVYILGRLGATPELMVAKSGDPYCRLRVATNRTKDHADWHSVFVFGKQAETCAKHLRKGATVLIEGRLNYWQSSDEGERKLYAQSIKADDVQFITTGAVAGGEAPSAAEPSPAGPSPQTIDNPGVPRNHDAVAHPA